MACERQRVGIANGRPVPIRPSSPIPIVSRTKKPFASRHGSGVRISRPKYNRVPGRCEHRKQQKHPPMKSNLQKRKRRSNDDKNKDSTPNQPTETPASSPNVPIEDEGITQPLSPLNLPAEMYHLTILSHNVRGAKEIKERDGTRTWS